MTQSVMGLFATLNINDTKHNNDIQRNYTQYCVSLCWVSRILKCYAESHYAECHYAKCSYPESYTAECHGTL